VTRRHWYDPVKEQWEFADLTTTDEEALALLRGSPDAEAYLRIYEEWRGLGAGVEHALLRVSALARKSETGDRRINDPRGPPGP
jgi:hypothetical protein